MGVSFPFCFMVCFVGHPFVVVCVVVCVCVCVCVCVACVTGGKIQGSSAPDAAHNRTPSTTLASRPTTPPSGGHVVGQGGGKAAPSSRLVSPSHSRRQGNGRPEAEHGGSEDAHRDADEAVLRHLLTRVMPERTKQLGMWSMASASAHGSTHVSKSPSPRFVVVPCVYVCWRVSGPCRVVSGPCCVVSCRVVLCRVVSCCVVVVLCCCCVVLH